MIYITSDHGGWAIKNKIVDWLKKEGIKITDIGPRQLDPQDDYPVWAARLANQVKNNRRHRGIAVCRSGVGMALAVNKVTGIRAVQGLNQSVVKRSRREEDTNVLSLAADLTSLPQLKKIIKAWLDTPALLKVRYRRRLQEIKRIERGR